MRVVSRAALLIMLVGLTACGGRSELRQGYVVFGFETSAFQPCGDAEQWWLTGDTDVMGELDRALLAVDETTGARLYVEVRGVLSREGNYGHLGAYPREFHVTEVVQARPEMEGDCPNPAAP
jgi:hypothetical protein